MHIYNYDYKIIGCYTDALESLKDQNDGNLKSLVLTKKVEVEDHIKFLTAAVGQLVEQRYHSGEDIFLLCESVSMVEELDTLSSFLIPSDFDVKAMTEIGQLLKSFEARRPELDMLLSRLTMENDPKGSVVFEEIDSTKFSDSKPDVSSEAEWTLHRSKKGKGRRI